MAQPRADGSPDRSVALVSTVTTLRPPEPLALAEREQQLGEGGFDAVLEEDRRGLVTDLRPVRCRRGRGAQPGASKLYATSLNQALARALDADVLLVGSWPRKPHGLGDLAEQLAIAAGGYNSAENARVVGCVVHGVPWVGPKPAYRRVDRA